MKVRVEPSRCQGHTLCAMLAPEVFELDDIDGHAHARNETVSGELGQHVREAARSCPEQAITFEEDRATETAPDGAIR